MIEHKFKVGDKVYFDMSRPDEAKPRYARARVVMLADRDNKVHNQSDYMLVAFTQDCGQPIVWVKQNVLIPRYTGRKKVVK